MNTPNGIVSIVPTLGMAPLDAVIAPDAVTSVIIRFRLVREIPVPKLIVVVPVQTRLLTAVVVNPVRAHAGALIPVQRYTVTPLPVLISRSKVMDAVSIDPLLSVSRISDGVSVKLANPIPAAAPSKIP